jgi:hypothetical protein
VNIEDLAGLVVLDTWILNRDRFWIDPASGRPRRNLGNVFFADAVDRPGKHRLVAMDHSECLRRGRSTLARAIPSIDAEQLDELHGLFPEFVPHVLRARVGRFVQQLGAVSDATIAAIVKGLPEAWLPAGATRDELAGFCARRAAFVAANIEAWLEGPCAWQTILFPS